ncbi:transposase [Pantoea allii]|nr:transposase [Pantoea allii]
MQEVWRQDYNECRPHSAVDYQTPSEFAAGRRRGKFDSKRTDITHDGGNEYWRQVS